TNWWGTIARLGWLGVALAGTLRTFSLRATQVPALVRESIHHPEFREREARNWDTLLARVATLPEPILVEDTDLDLPRGQKPFMLEASIFADLLLHGKFDDTDMRRRISAGEFAAIVTQ